MKKQNASCTTTPDIAIYVISHSSQLKEALDQALRSGHLSGAALDVHCHEPFVQGEGLLGAQDIPNLICTPHLGWYSPESQIEMRQKGAMVAKKACLGQRLMNVVNKEFLNVQKPSNKH